MKRCETCATRHSSASLVYLFTLYSVETISAQPKPLVEPSNTAYQNFPQVHCFKANIQTRRQSSNKAFINSASGFIMYKVQQHLSHASVAQVKMWPLCHTAAKHELSDDRLSNVRLKAHNCDTAHKLSLTAALISIQSY